MYRTSKIFGGSLRKVFLVFLAPCTIATVSAPLSLGADDGWHFGVEVRPLAVQILPNFLPQISQVPASLRTVPINPADAGAGTPVLIPAASVQPGSYSYLNSSVVPEISHGRFSLLAGAVFPELGIAPNAQTCSCGTTQEQNYQGSGRTVGAALVYYAGVVRPSYVPGLLGELEVRAGSHFSAVAGYQRSVHDVDIQTGYDRFDALQRAGTAVLARDVLQQPYLGIRWTLRADRRLKTSVFLNAGPAFVGKSPTALGSTTIFRYSGSPFFIATGLGLRWGRR